MKVCIEYAIYGKTSFTIAEIEGEKTPKKPWQKRSPVLIQHLNVKSFLGKAAKVIKVTSYKEVARSNKL